MTISYSQQLLAKALRDVFPSVSIGLATTVVLTTASSKYSTPTSGSLLLASFCCNDSGFLSHLRRYFVFWNTLFFLLSFLRELKLFSLHYFPSPFTTNHCCHSCQHNYFAASELWKEQVCCLPLGVLKANPLGSASVSFLHHGLVSSFFSHCHESFCQKSISCLVIRAQITDTTLL